MKRAFTLVEIMIVVAIIGVILAIAIPGFIRAREVSRGTACRENLTKIDGAKETWALETLKAGGSRPTWADLVGATLYIKTTPQCPGGGDYTIAGVGRNPRCSYVRPPWLLRKHAHVLPRVRVVDDGTGTITP